MTLKDRITVHHGDSREVLKTIADATFDSVVCDPPYALVSITKRFGKLGSAPAKGNDAYMRASGGFMGQQWDTGETAFHPEFWHEVLRVLKPGGHLVAFSGTRTYHRMASAIEDAGFEIRDCLQWLYGSGFPKSHDVSKAIDRHLGCERTKVRVAAASARNPKAAGAGRDGTEGASRPFIESAKERGFHEAVSDEAVDWHGWGTALKPAVEPICLARKPLVGTVAENVVAYATGAINVDGCRVGLEGGTRKVARKVASKVATVSVGGYLNAKAGDPIDAGRWPANVMHDGSAEVVALFPESESTRSELTSKPGAVSVNGAGLPSFTGTYGFDDSGSAARFFYTAKADADDRLGSKHPTVKPVDLMQWLVRLVTRRGGLVLDPFAGSGTTGEAAWREGMRAVLIEREERFVADINRRVELLLAGPEERSRATIKAKIEDGRIIDDPGPLFGGKAEPMRGGGGGRQIYGHFADQDERLARQDSNGE